MIMVEQIFHGVAYGGPLNGKIITHNSPYYRALEYIPMPVCTPSNMNQPVKIEIPIIEYRFNSHNQWVLID